jgi:methylthioribose-1-phosphate isomerase
MYVAAPSSTFDMACSTGDDIPIEMRQDSEVLHMDGVDAAGQLQYIRIAAAGVGANNPAFDVTPNINLTAIVNENGIWCSGAHNI